MVGGTAGEVPGAWRLERLAGAALSPNELGFRSSKMLCLVNRYWSEDSSPQQLIMMSVCKL